MVWRNRLRAIGRTAPVTRLPGDRLGAVRGVTATCGSGRADWYSEGYYSGAPLRDPPGPGAGKFRVLRGGSWKNQAARVPRARHRNAARPRTSANSATGFRVARTHRLARINHAAPSLLVEDELVNRELFRRPAGAEGYAVIAAEDGSSAVAATKSEKPDLVLMDLGLPDIDGWEATRRIKADPATAAIPVLVLSAHATNDARERAFAAGCEEFETKPVNWEALFKKIEEAIDKAVERREG